MAARKSAHSRFYIYKERGPEEIAMWSLASPLLKILARLCGFSVLGDLVGRY